MKQACSSRHSTFSDMQHAPCDRSGSPRNPALMTNFNFAHQVPGVPKQFTTFVARIPENGACDMHVFFAARESLFQAH